MKKTYYAVYDTNILVSALLTSRKDSPTALLLDMVLEGRVILLYNQDIIAEYKDVLSRKKFSFSQYDVENVLNLVKLGKELDPTISHEVFPDPDDAVFYEVALSKDGAYVVTVNMKHFPKNHIVVSPAEMIEIITNNR